MKTHKKLLQLTATVEAGEKQLAEMQAYLADAVDDRRAAEDDAAALRAQLFNDAQFMDAAQEDAVTAWGRVHDLQNTVDELHDEIDAISPADDPDPAPSKKRSRGGDVLSDVEYDHAAVVDGRAVLRESDEDHPPTYVKVRVIRRERDDGGVYNTFFAIPGDGASCIRYSSERQLTRLLCELKPDDASEEASEELVQ